MTNAERARAIRAKEFYYAPELERNITEALDEAERRGMERALEIMKSTAGTIFVKVDPVERQIRAAMEGK